MTEKYNIQAALEAGQELSKLQPVDLLSDKEKTPVLVKDGFHIQSVDSQLQKPTRKKGTKAFTDIKSFCFYVNKHKNEDTTTIIADEEKAKVLAVFNDSSEDEGGWGDFTALLKLGFSKQFEIWNKAAEENFGQEEFADFIEDNRTDIAAGTIDIDGKEFKNITPLELKALILDLKVNREQRFKSKLDPVTGETELSFEDQEKGKGSIKIPEKVILAIPVYKSGDYFFVTILLRLRVRDGQARFYYFIDQIERLKEKAFSKICTRIKTGVKNENQPDESFEGTNTEVLKGIISYKPE